MHIVFAHEKPLPVVAYGGIERIIFWLMKALIKKGHKVTLIGHSDSQVTKLGIHLIPGNAQNWFDLIPSDADIIHLFFPWHRELSKPFICGIGGNGKPGEVFPINTVFVSKSHAKNHSAECAVYNGIDLEEYPSSLLDRKRGFNQWSHFAFMAKAKWKVKNLKDCVRAVKHAKKELHIGGGRAWSLNRKIHSYGMVGQAQKFQILAKTDALLWPVRWPEPFGIAMIEAMAAGLPVIASGHGSSPEIVTPEVGQICKNYSEFSAAIQHSSQIYHPKKIREYVVENFSADHMCDAYIKCYETVLNGHTLNSRAPVATFSQDAQTLLKF